MGVGGGRSRGRPRDEAFLGALGGIARAVGGLLGGGGGGDTEFEEEAEGEVEFEEEYELEAELEEEAEEFFGRIRRAIGRIAKNPVFRTLAKTIGPDCRDRHRRAWRPGRWPAPPPRGSRASWRKRSRPSSKRWPPRP